MKKISLFFILLFVAFSALGQFFVHADTSNISDTRMSLIKEEIENQRRYLAELTESPKGEERAIRESCNFTTWQPNTREVHLGELIYWAKDSLSQDEKFLVQEELSQRADRIRKGHYNILFIKTDDYYRKGPNLVLASAQFPRPGLYAKLDTTFEINAQTRLPGVFHRLAFDPKPGEITYKYLTDDDYSCMTVPIHELSHLSTDGNKYLRYETSLFISKLCKRDIMDLDGNKWFNTFTGQTYAYYDNPSEIKARLDVLRYVLYREGLYDARYEDFTLTHIGLMLQSQNIEDPGITDLFEYIVKDIPSLIWMMNNVQ